MFCKRKHPGRARSFKNWVHSWSGGYRRVGYERGEAKIWNEHGWDLGRKPGRKQTWEETWGWDLQDVQAIPCNFLEATCNPMPKCQWEVAVGSDRQLFTVLVSSSVLQTTSECAHNSFAKDKRIHLNGVKSLCKKDQLGILGPVAKSRWQTQVANRGVNITLSTKSPECHIHLKEEPNCSSVACTGYSASTWDLLCILCSWYELRAAVFDWQINTMKAMGHKQAAK